MIAFFMIEVYGCTIYIKYYLEYVEYTVYEILYRVILRFGVFFINILFQCCCPKYVCVCVCFSCYVFKYSHKSTAQYLTSKVSAGNFSLDINFRHFYV